MIFQGGGPDLCFAVRCFVSILVLQSSRWGRENWLLCFVLFVLLVSRDCCLERKYVYIASSCCVALPHDVTGLSAVCD